jgi:hypothetical protein
MGAANTHVEGQFFKGGERLREYLTASCDCGQNLTLDEFAAFRFTIHVLTL